LEPKKRKLPKDDSLDLEARARFTFAAAAASDVEESGISTGNDKEDPNSDDLHGYIDEVINEIKKEKNEHLQTNKDDDNPI
jgi:hypothetical protein